MTEASVGRLWRHPVKSMWGEELDTLRLVEGGVLGDRCAALVGVETGERISAKHHGALLNCAARYLDEPTPTEPIPPIEVTFGDGTVVRDDPADVASRVSALLGLEVRLTTSTPGSLVDLAPVSVISVSTLRWLAERYPDGDWSPRRFRPNILVVDDDGFPGEDDWLGCDLHVGADAVIHAVMPTPRCVMTARAQVDLPGDRRILRTLTRERRRDVPVFGESGCAGTYADVVCPGVVRVGDPVRVEPVPPRRNCQRDLFGLADGPP